MKNFQEVLNRSDCYRLFSACFYEPDKDLFLEENVCLNLGSLMVAFPEAAAAAQKMHSALTEATQHDLLLDYAGLFIGPFELIAAPYGSIYLEGNGRLMGDTTIAIKRYYADEGLKVEVKEPPDHIAVELEFMSFLCKKEAAAIEQKNETESLRLSSLQADFFNSAMNWLPAFCKKITGGAQTAYYRSLGECLGNFYTVCEQSHKPKMSDR